MTDPRRRSPLAERDTIASPDGTYALVERPFLAKLILRVDPKRAAKAVKSAFGSDLPSASQTATAEGVTLLWLGPDEWMIVGDPVTETALTEKLAAALGDTPHQIAAVSDYYTTVSVSGARARDALSKLTTLDLHERSFKSGEVRGSVFAKAAAVLHMTGDGPPSFDLHIRASMADYLWCLLAVAGREYGMPQEQPRGGERIVI